MTIKLAIATRVLVISGFYKGLSSTDFEEKDNSFRIYANNREYVVHKSRCKLVIE